MKRMCHKFRVALLTLLILGLVVFPSAAKAAETSASFPEPTYTGSVNRVERSLIFQKNEIGEIITYFKVGDEDPVRFGRDIDAGFDQYGTIWIVDKYFGGCVGWWNYELAGGDTSKISGFTLIANPENPMDFLQGIESLVYEGTGTGAVVTGYKDSSGKIHPLLSFEEMREIENPESSIQEPSYVPSVSVETSTIETPTIETPLPSPTVTPQESVSILNTYIGYVDGVGGVDGMNGVDKVEQTLLVTKDDSGKIIPYFTIEGWDYYEDLDYYQNILVDAAVDEYGSVQLLREDGRVLWWNYYVTPDLSVKTYTFLDLTSIESFIFDGSGSQSVIVGYRSTTGEIYPVPSFEEMKEQSDFYKSKVTPHYIPKGVTPKPSAIPTTKPTEMPATAAPTAEPSVTPKPTNTPDISSTENPEITSTTRPLPTVNPTAEPSVTPKPTNIPDISPTEHPGITPTTQPLPTVKPTQKPTDSPIPPPKATSSPTESPTFSPEDTSSPTDTPQPTSSSEPSKQPPQTTFVPSATASPNPNEIGVSDNRIEKRLKKGDSFVAGNIKYRVTKIKGKKGEAAVSGVKSKKSKSFVIPQKVKKDGVTFTVTSIRKNAFKGCKKAKTLTIKSTSIRGITKKALTGLVKQIQIRIPKSKTAQYWSVLRKLGYSKINW